MQDWKDYAKENGIESAEAYRALFIAHYHDEYGVATVSMNAAMEAIKIAEKAAREQK